MSKTVRISNATLERLRDAADRHGMTMAEVMRRASRAYLNRLHRDGVVILPNRESTTRETSTPVQPLGLHEGIDPCLFGQLITWYLDNFDTGYRKPVPTIDEADLNTPYIIEETV